MIEHGERPDGMSESPAGAKAPARQFVDSRGERWSVQQRDTRGEPGARGESCLIFAGDNTIRRAWKYPAEWRSLSAEALEALSERP